MRKGVSQNGASHVRNELPRFGDDWITYHQVFDFACLRHDCLLKNQNQINQPGAEMPCEGANVNRVVARRSDDFKQNTNLLRSVPVSLKGKTDNLAFVFSESRPNLSTKHLPHMLQYHGCFVESLGVTRDQIACVAQLR
jgi:hypothetical protein